MTSLICPTNPVARRLREKMPDWIPMFRRKLEDAEASKTASEAIRAMRARFDNASGR